jgi:hypothetical protein
MALDCVVAALLEMTCSSTEMGDESRDQRGSSTPNRFSGEIIAE